MSHEESEDITIRAKSAAKDAGLDHSMFGDHHYYIPAPSLRSRVSRLFKRPTGPTIGHVTTVVQKREPSFVKLCVLAVIVAAGIGGGVYFGLAHNRSEPPYPQYRYGGDADYFEKQRMKQRIDELETWKRGEEFKEMFKPLR